MFFLAKHYDRNKDFSEGNFRDKNNIFNKDMSAHDATLNKYQNIFDKLELKEGMSLLDAGCGTGVWLDFCKKRGVNVVGITICPEQAEAVRAKGIEVYLSDYRRQIDNFIGKFDRITALGSTEHISSSRGTLAGTIARERSVKTLTEVWQLFNRYLKPEGMCFYTFLTVNERAHWGARDYLQSWILEQHYGGYYPYKDDVRDKVIPQTGFVMQDEEDHTDDYHWTSMADPEHFGNFKINWSEDPSAKIMHTLWGLFNNARQLPFHWLYYLCDTWMWQFGGPQDTPLTKTQVDKAHMQLMYFTAKKVNQISEAGSNFGEKDMVLRPAIKYS
jgi:cyclopropane fatty-acyl-phospholipid synthase-like methyltransferase